MTRVAPVFDLHAAYHMCALITRQRARNFYYGLRLTPEPRRSAIYSVYAWMRHADDLADSEADADAKASALADFVAQTHRAVGDGDGAPQDPPRDPVLRAFAETVRRYRLDEQDIHGLIEGLESDLRFESQHTAPDDEPMFADRAAFEEYCYRVASTVGRVCVRIWGLVDGGGEAEAMRLAVERGLAFQTTNILRDFREDFDGDAGSGGRVYLPAEVFKRHGVTPRQLRAWDDPDRCRALVVEVGGWARSWYESSSALDAMILPECRPAIRAMTRIYRSLLDIILDDPARVAGDRRVRVKSWRKAAIALGAVREARSRA